MIENQNISNDVSVTEKVNGGGEAVVLTEEENTVVVYDLSPEDFDAAVEKAKEVYIDSKGEGTSSGTICSPRVSEVWFKFTIPQSATYSIRTVGQFDTIGKLYASSGNPIIEVDDNELCGKSNFRMRVDLTEGATYYLRVTIADAESGTCYLIISRRLPVDYVETVPKTIVLDVGKTYQLPYDIEYTNLNIPNVPCVENLKLAVVPAEAEERSVSWYNNAGDIVEIKRSTFNNTVCQTIKGNTPGVGYLYVGDALDNGRWAEVTVIVKNPNDTIVHYNIVSKATGEAVSFTGAIDQEGGNNVCCRPLNNTNVQLWYINNTSSSQVCYVRCYLDEEYGLNYNTDSYNCDLAKIAEDQVNTAVCFIKQANGYYKIKSANHPDYYLTISSNNSVANINWQKVSSEEDRQLWRLEAVDLEYHKAQQVEYHLIPYSDISTFNKRALQVDMNTPNDGGLVNKTFRLTNDEPLELATFSYVNKQKWLFKRIGSKCRIYTSHGDNYCLCKQEEKEEVYVSNKSTVESLVTVIKYNNSNDLVEIKLTSSNLYLTVHDEEIIWAAYDNANHSKQVWKKEGLPSNLHNGCDTRERLTNDTARALKYNNEAFVIRYYGLLDYFGDVNIQTMKDGQSVISKTIDDLENMCVWLRNESFDYLQCVDQLFEFDENGNLVPLVNIKYLEKTITPSELQAIKDQGLKVVVVYQNYSNGIQHFTLDHARLDAFCALVDAKRIGQPYGSTIYFAVDFDATDMDQITAYFDTIKKVIKGRYKIGVYGSGLTCKTIKENCDVSYTWLCQSTGYAEYPDYDTTSKYNIKQAERTVYNDVIFDDDVAVGSDYGQWDP